MYFNPNQVLGDFLTGRQERGNYLEKVILRLLLIDYIERRYGVSLSITAEDSEIDKVLREALVRD